MKNNGKQYLYYQASEQRRWEKLYRINEKNIKWQINKIKMDVVHGQTINRNGEYIRNKKITTD